MAIFSMALAGSWCTNMGDEYVKRAWKFEIEDWDEETEYWREDGADDDFIFIGTGAEAQEEADRIADAWENRNDAFCSKVTMESQGKI